MKRLELISSWFIFYLLDNSDYIKIFAMDDQSYCLSPTLPLFPANVRPSLSASFPMSFRKPWLLTNHAIRMGLLTNRTIVPHLYGKTRYILFSHPSKHTNNYPPNKRWNVLYQYIHARELSLFPIKEVKTDRLFLPNLQPFNARKVGSKSRNSTSSLYFFTGFRLLFMFSGNFIIKGIAAEPS